MDKQSASRKSSLAGIKASGIGLILIIFISASTGFAGGLVGARNTNIKTDSNAAIEQGRQTIEEQGNVITSIAKQVGPSVVSINVTSEGVVNSGFFGSPQAVEQQSAGTGFIISDDGYVMTNRHVIPDGSKKVSLVTSDGTVLDDVSVVGRTSDSDPLDLGFLKINDTKGKKLPAVKIGDSSKMQVGNTVIAIGNALGQFQNTVTSGIISGYGRSVQASGQDGGGSENLQNLFQTDAAINQGNSGGPLVNGNGQVIGVNTAVAGGGAQNIGFAIPINDTKGLVKGVLEKGQLQRPYLGVRYIQLSPAASKELGIQQDSGAYISGSGGNSGVMAGSPAAKAGLKDKDIIIKINDQPVDSKNTLASVVGRFTVGDTVTVTYLRDGKEQTSKLKLAELPNN